MSVTFVNSNSATAGSNEAGDGVTSVNLSLSVTAGNVVVVGLLAGVYGVSVPTPSVAGTKDNAYVQAVGDWYSGAAAGAWFFAATVASTGTDTITATISGASAGLGLIAWQFSGDGQLVVNASSYATAGSSSGAISSGSMTTTRTAAVVGIATIPNGGGTWTAGSGCTQTFSQAGSGSGGTTSAGFFAEYETGVAAGSVAATMSTSSTGSLYPWIAAAVAITDGTYTLPVSVGSYSISGETEDLLAPLHAVAGSYSIAGVNESLTPAAKLATSVGSYEISGDNASFAIVGLGIVQTTGAGSGDSSESSITVTFANPVTEGNLLIALCGARVTSGSPSFSVADSDGNDWIDAAYLDTTGADPLVGASVWWTQAGSSTSGLEVTLTSTGYLFLAIMEVQGAAAFEVNAYATAAGTSTSSAGISSGAMTTTSKSLVIGIGITDGLSGTWIPGTGFTSIFAQTGDATKANCLAEYQVNVSPGSPAATMTTTIKNSDLPWIVVGVAFSSLAYGGGNLVGSYSLTGINESLLAVRLETASVGSYAIAGETETLTGQAEIFAAVGSYVVTGANESLYHTHIEIASVGSYAINGVNESLVGAAGIMGAAGSYSIGGVEPELLWSHQLTGAPAGSYAITGAGAHLFPGWILDAAAGSYAITGVDEGLLWKRKLVAVKGSYAIAGVVGDLYPSGFMVTSAGTYTVGRVTEQLWDFRIETGGLGSYAIAGVDAVATPGWILDAAHGSYAVTGAQIQGEWSRYAEPSAVGVYTVTGVLASFFAVLPDGSTGPVEYHVYANTGAGDPINYDSPIDTTSSTTFTTAPLTYPGTWSIGVRAFYVVSGLEEKNVDCAQTFVLNAAGVDVSNIPNPPTGLRAIAMVGGAIKVEWFYPPTTGPTAPTGFHVFTGPGTMANYTSPVATVFYSSGYANAFVANLAGYSDGVAYAVGVRAFNGSGTDTNTNVVAVTAIASGPSAVECLTAVATATA